MGKKDVHKLTPVSEQSFVLLGISSHENDYRLTWALNEQLGFHFVKTDNHRSYNTKLKESQEFSAYLFPGDDYSGYCKLISNRCDNGFLLEELKAIDFFLLIEDDYVRPTVAGLVVKIKAIPLVSAVFVLDLPSIKGRARLF
jgi:hypothetical protein